jgi:mannose-1-phosphate guanylyltransferase
MSAGDGSANKRNALVLAGGDGTRLAALTEHISGRPVPKQFCPIISSQTLLELTWNRVTLGIDPARTLTSVTKSHEPFYSRLSNDRPLAVQPGNRGTAPAVLYGLLRLWLMFGDGTVVIFPSDHYISDDMAFMRYVDIACSAIEEIPQVVAMLGFEADRPETQYGWIEPGEPLVVGLLGKALLTVRRFWEKPPFALANELWCRSCLWNSFVLMGRLSTLLKLIARTLPELHRSFMRIVGALGTEHESAAIDALYSELPLANFSEAVMAASPRQLAVLPVSGLDWNDLGEPERVFATLSRTGLRPEWARHLATAEVVGYQR